MALILLLLAVALWLALSFVLLRMFAVPMAGQTRRTRRVMAMAAAAGFLGALIWGVALPGSLGIEAPALVMRLAGAAGLAAGVVLITVMRRPSPARVRFGLGIVATGLAPMLLLMNAHRDWVAPGILPWVLGGVLTALSVGATLEMVKSKDLRPAPAPGALERLLWAVLIVLSAVAAVVLMLGPLVAEPAAGWTGNGAASNVLGAIPLTLFMMSWMARNRAMLARPAGIGCAVLGLWGLAAVVLEGGPLWLGMVLGVLGLLGGLRALRP